MDCLDKYFRVPKNALKILTFSGYSLDEPEKFPGLGTLQEPLFQAENPRDLFFFF